MDRHLIWLGLVLTIFLSKEAFAQEPKVPADVTTLVRSIKVLQARLRNEYLSPNSVNGFLDGDEIFPNIPALQQVKDMYTDKVIAKYYASRKKRSVENDAKVQHREKRGIMAFSNSLLASGKWPNGRIDYAINQTLSAEQKSIITQALSWWTQKTCIQFREVFQSNNPRQPYVLFTQGASCVSFVGRTVENVPQPTYLDANCFQLVGRIAHEVGHVIGLWHTHQLSTRGDYVTVFPNNMNVQNDGEIVDLPASIINYYNLPYDYASIMHYNPRIFARPGLKTIETRDPLFQQTIGQRSEISFQDAKLVNLEYCAGNCQNVNVRVNCQNGGYQDPANCGRCICADGWTGTLCTDVDSRRCGGDILVDGRGGSISTPGFDQFQTYQDNLLCAWRLRNTFGQNIVLEFDNRFGVYCFGDTAFHWVELRINGTLYDTGYRFCGTQRPDNVFVSLNPSKEVMVVFKSPYNAPSSFRRTGFKLSYRMENQVGCNGGVCENGGTCNVADAVCVCRQGFIGIRCEVDDRCNQGYCRNGATCTLRPNAVPLCSCQPRFTGSRCQTAEPNPTPTPAPTPAPPQGNCGACGLPPGKTQVACNSTTETEEYEVLCETVADPARFSLFGGGGWGGRGRNRRRQTRWCTAELAKKYCCVNAVLMRVNNDFICGVPGWSDWGPCAGETCGGCGIRRRSQYEVIKQFDRNTCYNDRLVICGEEKTGCNFAPCPLDQCGTGNTQVRDDSWDHGWDSGSWEDSHEDHGFWFGRRKKRGLFDWLFGSGGGGGGGGGGGRGHHDPFGRQQGECVNQCCTPYSLSSDGSTCSDGSTVPDSGPLRPNNPNIDPNHQNPVTPSTTTQSFLEPLIQDDNTQNNWAQWNPRTPSTLPPWVRGRRRRTTLPAWAYDP